MTSSGGTPLLEHISLQQAGFTIFCRHRRKLWALTSLFSPLPPVRSTGIVNVQVSM